MSHRRALLALALLPLLPGCFRSGPGGYQGYVEGDFVYLASSQGGHLEHLAVARGQQVRQGDLAFSLEATVERAEQQQARQQLAATQAQLADLQTGKRQPELAVIRAQLAQAQAVAQKSQAQRQRDEVQLRAGGISREQFEATAAQAAADAARVRELDSQLEVARLPGRAEQVRAQSEQVEAAKAALAQATWKVEQKSVRAPAGGLIYDTLYREGEWVQAGSPVVSLLPPANVKVRFFVPEPILGALAIGREVRLRCDGCASGIGATVTYLSSQAEYTPPVIYSNETRSKLVFMVEAHPRAADAARLHPGQPLVVQLP